MHTLLYIIYLLAVPIIVMRLERRWRWITRVSPMTLLYIIGLLVANFTAFADMEQVGGVNSLMYSLAVPLAIPLLLLSCNLRGWSIAHAAKVFFTGLFSVVAMCIAGWFIFRNGAGDMRFAQVAAGTTGMYTGGIPNLGAIAQAVNLPPEIYIYLTSYDLIVTGLYLVFIIFAGKAVFRRLLPLKEMPKESFSGGVVADSTPLTKTYVWRQMWLPALLTLIIVAIAFVAAKLTGKAGEMNMTVLILTLTTCAILASLLRPIRLINQTAAHRRRQPLSFDCGLYLVYLFCFCIASACDVRKMDLTGSLDILYFLAVVIFGSLVLQVILAKLLHIDGDSVMVSSISLINSPPFVPMVAALLGNKDVIVLGITVGLLGYMLGNYMGIGIFHLLMWLP